MLQTCITAFAVLLFWGGLTWSLITVGDVLAAQTAYRVADPQPCRDWP